MSYWAGILAVGRVDRLVELQRYFAGRSGSGRAATALVLLLAVGGAGVLLIGLSRLISQRRSRRRNSARLFEEVLAGLNLPWSDRLLLRRMARRLGLANPVVMLLSPNLLARHGYWWADRLAVGRLRDTGLARLDAACRRLFGQALPARDALAGAEKRPTPAEPPGGSSSNQPGQR